MGRSFRFRARATTRDCPYKGGVDDLLGKGECDSPLQWDEGGMYGRMAYAHKPLRATTRDCLYMGRGDNAIGGNHKGLPVQGKGL